jgi:hypothetical protein
MRAAEQLGGGLQVLDGVDVPSRAAGGFSAETRGLGAKATRWTGAARTRHRGDDENIVESLRVNWSLQGTRNRKRRERKRVAAVQGNGEGLGLA